MPTYDYLCADCGPFSTIMPMSASGDPQACPACRSPSPRALLSFPAMGRMTTEGRLAAATNERNRHAPMTAGEYRDQSARRHRAGCACCAPAKPKLTADAPPAAKGFPNKRPWMISH